MGGATAPSSAELKTGLSQALDAGEDTRGSIELGERTRAVASPIRGEAAHAKVGYMIGRKGSTVGLGGLFANTFKEDVASLPWLVVIGIPLLLFCSACSCSTSSTTRRSASCERRARASRRTS